MPAIEAQLRPEFAHLYPGINPGEWYHINQSARELESNRADALRIEVGEELVEVNVDHIQRREVGPRA